MVAQIKKRYTVRRLARNSEEVIKGTIGGLHSQVGVEDDQRHHNRIENDLRVLPLVNGLLNTGTKSGHVGASDHGAVDLVVASLVRRNIKSEPPLAVPEFRPARHS